MSDHLPECPVNNIDIAGLCMCHELRRCEQRMREGWYEVQSETWMQGFRYALNAAREAVAALPEYRMRDTCVFAIDALKEKT